MIKPPGDPDCRIVPSHRYLVGRTVIFIAFVEEVGDVRKDCKTVGETSRHPKLAPVPFAQFDRNMLAKRWAADANVDRHVHNVAAQNADQFALASGILQMQTANHPMRRTRYVVLHEWPTQPVDRIAIGPKGLKEEASLVTEQFRLNDQYFGDWSAEDIHAEACP